MKKILHREWSTTSIGNICEIIRGVSYDKRVSRETPADGHLPILRATNIQDNQLVLDKDLVYVPSSLVSEVQKLEKGDIVIATSSGSKHLVGKAAQLKKKWRGSFGAFCAGLRCSDDVDSAYVQFFFSSQGCKKQISSKALGVNINNLRRSDIENISIPLAPLNVQRSIVAEIEKQFSRLDEAVAGLKRVKANLKRYKAAVLKAAVEGKLTEEWRKQNPNIEPADKLLKRILAERKKKWEAEHPGKKYKEPIAPDTSNLPALPEGWVWATVEQLAAKIQYGSSSKTNEDREGVPVIRMGNIFEGRLKLDDLKYLPRHHSEFPELLLKKNDLLFNRTNSPELVGKTALYKGISKQCSFASYLIRVQFNDGASSDFVSFCINSDYGRRWIKSVVSQQVGQANVNGSKLQALSVPLPPHAEQQKIVEEVESCLSVAEEIEAAVETNLKRAERLRQAILKKAFLGHIT